MSHAGGAEAAAGAAGAGGAGACHFFVKVSVVGDSGVGKSALLRAEEALDGDFGGAGARAGGGKRAGAAGGGGAPLGFLHEADPAGSPSIHFKTRDYNLNGFAYKVQYWDCPGSERYAALTSKYCSGSAGIVFVFDLTNSKSFRRVSEWIELLEAANPRARKVLVGNKYGSIAAPRQVQRQAAEQLAEKFGLQYFETDALQPQRCEAVFRDLFFQIAEAIPVPTEPRDLVGMGIKIGPLLLQDKAYRQQLQQQTS
jgi:small GTP-binding protein